MWCVGSGAGLEAGSGAVGARGSSGGGAESCLQLDLDEEAWAAISAGSLRGRMVE